MRADTREIIFARLLVYPATLGQWGVSVGAGNINIANNRVPVSALKNITLTGTGFVIYSTKATLSRVIRSFFGKKFPPYVFLQRRYPASTKLHLRLED